MNKLLVDGKEINNGKEIKKEFKKFYAKLHQENQVEKKDIKKYLEECEIPELTEDQRKILEDHITEEVEEAISEAKNGKSPGVDGYTAKFYKVFKEEIVIFLQKLFKGIMKGSRILETWQKAIITLIPKEENQ